MYHDYGELEVQHSFKAWFNGAPWMFDTEVAEMAGRIVEPGNRVYELPQGEYRDRSKNVVMTIGADGEVSFRLITTTGIRRVRG